MVRAVNKAAEFQRTALLAVGTPSGKPGALTGLTATPGTTDAAGKVTVTLAWTEPDDGGSALLDYEYEILKADGTPLRAWKPHDAG